MKFLSTEPKKNLAGHKDSIGNSLKQNTGSQADHTFSSLLHRASRMLVPNLKNREKDKISKNKMEFTFPQFLRSMNIDTMEYIGNEYRNLEGKSGYKIGEGPVLKGLYVGFLKLDENKKRIFFKCLLEEEEVTLHKFKFKKAQHKKVIQFLKRSENQTDSLENTSNFINITWVSDVKEKLFLTSNRKLLIITETYDETLENILKKRHISDKFYTDSEILGFLNKSIETIKKLHEKGLVHLGITIDSWIIGQHGDYKLLYLGEHWEENNELSWNVNRMSIRSVAPELKRCFEEFRDTENTQKKDTINLYACDYYSLGVVVLEMMFLSRKSIENYRSLNQLINLLSKKYAKSSSMVKSLLDENPEKRIIDKKTMEYLDLNGVKQLDIYFKDLPKKLRKIDNDSNNSSMNSRFYTYNISDIKSKIELIFILKDFSQIQTNFKEIEDASEKDDLISKLDKHKLYIMKAISERKLGLIEESNISLDKACLNISKEDINNMELLTEIKYHQAKNNCLLGDLESAEDKIKEIWQSSNLEIRFSEYSLILLYSFFAKIMFLKHDYDSALQNLKFVLKTIKDSKNPDDYHEKKFSLLLFKLTIYQKFFHFSKSFYIASKLISRSESLKHILISLFEQIILTFQMNIEHHRKILLERVLKIFEERWTEIEKLRIDVFLNIFYSYSFLFKFFESNDKVKIKEILESYLETAQKYPLNTLSKNFSLFFQLTFAKAFYFLGDFVQSSALLKFFKKKREDNFLIVEAIYFKELIENKLEKNNPQLCYKEFKSLLKNFWSSKKNMNGRINDYLLTLERNMLCRCSQESYSAQNLIEAASSNYLKSEIYLIFIRDIFENKKLFENNYISEAFFVLKQEKYSGFIIHNFTIKLIIIFLMNNLPQSAWLALQLVRKNLETNNFGFEQKYIQILKTYEFDYSVNCELIFLEGLIMKCLNKKDESLNYFNQFYEIIDKRKLNNMNEKKKIVLSLLIELNEEKGRFNQVIFWTQNFLEIEPENIIFLDKLAGFYSEFGFFDRSIQILRTMKEENNNFIVCCKLAELYLKIGDLKTFEELYKKLEDCNLDGISHFPLAYYLRLTGLYNCFMENYNSAEKDFEHCIEKLQSVFKKDDYIILGTQLLLYEMKLKLKQNINIKFETLYELGNDHFSNQILLLELNFSIDNNEDIGLIKKRLENLEEMINENNNENNHNNMFLIKLIILKFDLHLREGNLTAAEEELGKTINHHKYFCAEATSHYSIIKMRNFLFKSKLKKLQVQKIIESLKQFQTIPEDKTLEILNFVSDPEWQDKFIQTYQQDNNERKYNDLLMEIKSNSIKLKLQDHNKNENFIDFGVLEKGIQNNYEMAKKELEPFFENHPIILDAAKNLEILQLL